MFLSRSPKAAGLGRRQGGDGDVKEKGSSLDLGEVWCPSSTDLCRNPTALQLRLSGGRSDMSSLKAQRHRRGQKLEMNGVGEEREEREGRRNYKTICF